MVVAVGVPIGIRMAVAVYGRMNGSAFAELRRDRWMDDWVFAHRSFGGQWFVVGALVSRALTRRSYGLWRRRFGLGGFKWGFAFDIWVRVREVTFTGEILIFGHAADRWQGLDWRAELRRTQRDLLPDFIEARLKLEIHLQEKLGRHQAVVLLLESGPDLFEMFMGVLELLFIGRNVMLLDFLELDIFEQMNGLSILFFPAEEGGFGNVQVFGNPGQAPAVGAQDDE